MQMTSVAKFSNNIAYHANEVGPYNSWLHCIFDEVNIQSKYFQRSLYSLI